MPAGYRIQGTKRGVLSDDARTNTATKNGEVDGRTARRDRNRDAAIDALIDLIEAGDMFPTMADIADRSGVSHRSVFRYFEHREELFGQAVQRAFGRYAPLTAIRSYGRGPFDDRVQALVDQRLILYAAIAPVARAVKLRPHLSEPFTNVVGSGFAPLRAQLEVQFAPELEQRSEGDRDHLVSALDVMLSFDGYELLTHAQGRPVDEVGRVWRTGIIAIIGGG